MAFAKDRTIVRGRTHDPIARLEKSETDDPQPSRFSIGMWAVVLFVASEAMFFAALFTAYFYLRGAIPDWQPVFGHKPSWEGLPIINTVILVSSSLTMQLGVWAIRKGNRTALRNWLALTVLMGVIFLAGQGYEYTQLGFVPSDSIFSAVFYTLTGFHGAHVFGGVMFMAICLLRTLRGQFSANRHLAVEAASIYWHFVDVVWIGLFITIYIVG